jgi:hypothetical protein
VSDLTPHPIHERAMIANQLRGLDSIPVAIANSLAEPSL